MLGILLYIYFLFVGFLYSNELFKNKDIYFRGYMGGIFGNLILMAGIVPLAFVFKFSYLSHILLIIIAILPYLIIKLKSKEKIISIPKGGEESITPKILICLILPISLIIWVLMTNHILTPYDGGGVASGQCTYGDLQMHLGFVTSIAEQKSFPPEYPFLAGQRLNYPFFVDMLSSSLYLFGTPLRWAVLVPSYVLSLLLVTGFYMLAYKITAKKIGGGFGCGVLFYKRRLWICLFFRGSKSRPDSLYKDIYGLLPYAHKL